MGLDLFIDCSQSDAAFSHEETRREVRTADPRRCVERPAVPGC